MTGRRLLATFMILTALAGVGGCGAKSLIDDVVKNADDIARQGNRLDELGLPPVAIGSADGAAPAAKDLLADLRGLSEDDLRTTIKGACFAKDAVEIGQANSIEEGVGIALVNFGGNATLHTRMETLAHDMLTAEKQLDVPMMVATASACELT